MRDVVSGWEALDMADELRRIAKRLWASAMKKDDPHEAALAQKVYSIAIELKELPWKAR